MCKTFMQTTKKYFIILRSLEVQTPDRSAWRQYFTLGEIFKAYGHFQESILHLKHALELHPNHELISKALRDVENIPPASTLHIYTIIIIVCLVRRRCQYG